MLESADGGGNIRVYSHEIVGLYCTLKAATRRPPPPVFLFRSGCSIERAASQGEIALYILLAAPRAVRAIMRFFARPRLRPIQRKTAARQRLTALNAIHSAFCRCNMRHLSAFNPSNLHKRTCTRDIRSMIHASMVTEQLVCRPLDQFYKQVFFFSVTAIYIFIYREVREHVFFYV